MVTGLTQMERVRLHYSICSLCSAGQLAECRVGVNDPRQSASANFRGPAVRVRLRISRILADLRPQADASAGGRVRRPHISAGRGTFFVPEAKHAKHFLCF